MNYKKTTLIVLAFLVVVGISVLVAKQKSAPRINAPSQDTKPLSNVDEVVLQKQLQEIIAKGNESECETLSDSRYQLACHDMFRNTRK